MAANIPVKTFPAFGLHWMSRKRAAFPSTLGAMRALGVAALVFGIVASHCFADEGSPNAAVLRAEVNKLVHAAQRRKELWPWKPAGPEVDEAASYGRAITPLLLAKLAANPDDTEKNDGSLDWPIQQEIALTLCKIYGVKAAPGRVYMNRASAADNAGIKAFWTHGIKGSQ